MKYLYVELPAGACFAIHYGVHYFKFGKSSGKPEIDLTQILALYKESGTSSDPHIKVYLEHPPEDDKIYLRYRYPSFTYDRHITGYKANHPTPQTQKYGQLWFQEVYLDEERRIEEDEKRAEQRFERRTKGVRSV